LALTGILLAAMCCAEEPAKPRCSSSLQSHFWPEQANHDPKFARAAAQAGQLEVCTLGKVRHRWRLVAVTLDQLARKHGPKKPPAGTLAARTDHPSAP
jgi:hypothetical protein